MWWERGEDLRKEKSRKGGAWQWPRNAVAQGKALRVVKWKYERGW
jgi:hypothetical protein